MALYKASGIPAPAIRASIRERRINFCPIWGLRASQAATCLKFTARSIAKWNFINPHFGLVIFLSLFVFLRLRDYFFDRFYERNSCAIHSQHFIVAVFIAYFIADFR